MFFGTWINQDNGGQWSTPNHISSDFIPVNPNTRYRMTNDTIRMVNPRGVLYDANQEYISGHVRVDTVDSYEFTTNAQTRFVRVSAGLPSGVAVNDESFNRFRNGWNLEEVS